MLLKMSTEKKKNTCVGQKGKNGKRKGEKKEKEEEEEERELRCSVSGSVTVRQAASEGGTTSCDAGAARCVRTSTPQPRVQCSS